MEFGIGSTQVFVPSTAIVVLAGGLIVVLFWFLLGMLFGRPDARLEPRSLDYPRVLARSRNRAIAGVCSGIARYFGWQTGTTRAAFVFLSLFGGATPLLVYLVLWRLMPLEPMPERSVDLSAFRVD